MRIGVLGTGIVGRTLAEGLARIGHDVTIGTRDVDALLARTEPDQMGTPPFAAWHVDHGGVGLELFPAAGAGAELLVNATLGTASVEALTAAGAGDVAGRIVVDASNPLDFSGGFPPSLWVANTDSLGEQDPASVPGDARREGVEHDDVGADDAARVSSRAAITRSCCAETTRRPRRPSRGSSGRSDGATSSIWATSRTRERWRPT